jgi:hypothetical protein
VYGGSGVEAPHLIALFRRSNGTVALWLEDVEGLPGGRWTIEQFASLGRCLGRAQGALAVHGVPDFPWLSRGFLRDYTTSRGVDRSVLDSEEAWDHPVVRQYVPAMLRVEGPRLVAEREQFFDVMERLPRTLCHLDVWPNNLVARPDGRSVLFDWAFAGDGALGEDIGNLIPDSVFDLFLPARLLPDLEAAVYDAYVEGLREAGWKGDQRLVRLGMCASAVKYEWLLPHMLMGAGDAQQLDYGGEGTVAPEIRYAERGATLAYLMRWLNEARSLRAELSI